MEDIEYYSEYAYNFIKTICEEIGPRYSCSKEERQANEWIYSELKSFSDEANIEEFTTHPNIYPQGILRVFFIFGLIAFFLIPLPFPFSIFSSVAVFLGLLVFISELMLIVGILKPFFKKGISTNVYGIIKPKKSVKFRVILDGHTDSAKEMKTASLGTKKPMITLIAFIVSIFYLVYTFVFPIVKIAIQASSPSNFILYKFSIIEWTSLDWFYYIPNTLFFIVYIIVFTGFIGNKVVVGANDNLSGSAVATAVGKYFSKNRLNNVELIIVSTGSEEVGERGAKNLVKRHPEFFKDSLSLVFECIGAGEEILIIRYDFMHLTKYSNSVITRLEKAHKLYSKTNPNTLPIRTGNLLLGSSNANIYRKAGYDATFIINLDETRKKPANWHSSEDTFENIDQSVLKEMIGLSITFVNLIDDEFKFND
ncbi:MAG: M28 family peptidase [Candidatus Heimdallarchaeota archaeon]|nr:M28 family peptidase [Candidatus Heimdallarchaeota archaeon]